MNEKKKWKLSQSYSFYAVFLYVKAYYPFFPSSTLYSFYFYKKKTGSSRREHKHTQTQMKSSQYFQPVWKSVE